MITKIYYAVVERISAREDMPTAHCKLHLLYDLPNASFDYHPKSFPMILVWLSFPIVISAIIQGNGCQINHFCPNDSPLIFSCNRQIIKH